MIGNKQDPFGNMKNFQTMRDQFVQNPMGFLSQRGLNIPQEYQNDPNAALQYLMNNGKLNQQQYNFLVQMARNFGIMA